jgi:hypothetical protein
MSMTVRHFVSRLLHHNSRSVHAITTRHKRREYKYLMICPRIIRLIVSPGSGERVVHQALGAGKMLFLTAPSCEVVSLRPFALGGLAFAVLAGESSAEQSEGRE